jgi:hypothetical protein
MTGKASGLVLSTVPIIVVTEVNNENPQQDNLYPGLNPKPSKHNAGVVRFSALLN